MDNFTTLQSFSLLENFDLGNFTGVGDGQLQPQPITDNNLPDRGITAGNILIIYRSDNQTSIDVKDYLIANRPRYSSALTLAVNLSTATLTNDGDTIPQAELTSLILNPLSTFLSSNPEVMFTYLSWGIPLRIKENESIPLAPTYPSVQYQIAHLDDNDDIDMYDPYTDESQSNIPFDEDTALFIPENQDAFAGTRTLVSSFWFLSTADVYAYIDWIRSVYNSLDSANQGICISGKAAQVMGETYLLDDNREASLDGALLNQASWSRDFILYEDSGASIDFRADATTVIITGENPKGFHSWGYHATGGQPFASTESWESDGSLIWTGDKTRWYPVQIEESYATVRNNPNPPTVLTRLGFFSSTAGGLTNYEGTCIFLVGSVEEPYNSLNAGNYFGLFERGYPIGMSAWRSRRSIHFNCFGDMLLTIADPIPFTVQPPTRDYDTVFGALSSQITEITNCRKGNTGFLLENTKLPYITLGKTGDFFHTRYSCGTQLEHGIYQFHVYTESLAELQKIFYEIENQYTNSDLPLNSEVLTQSNLEWAGQKVKEVEPGVYHGTLLYHIIVQRDIPTTFSSIVTSGETLLGALHNRFKFFGEIREHVNSFVSSKFQLEKAKLPYISIDEFDTIEFDRTSKTRQEQTRFSLKVHTESLQKLETIQSVIRKYYDNCVLNVSSFGQFLCLTWNACTSVEKEPGVWEGTIEYELLLERDIDAYGNR